jgi:hypothetical protein
MVVIPNTRSMNAWSSSWWFGFLSCCWRDG